MIFCTQMFPSDVDGEALISGMIKNPYNQIMSVSNVLESVDVITTSDEKFHKKTNDMDVWGIGLAPLKGVFKSTIFEFKILLQILSICRNKEIDLIHIHHLNIPLLFLFRFLGFFTSKIVYTAHGTSTPELNAARQGSKLKHNLLRINGLVQHFIDRLCWSLADLVIVPSEFQLKEMRTLYNVPDQKLAVVYNGYDEKLYFRDDGYRKEIRKELCIDDNVKVLLFVGRAASKKGIVELIKTCDKLRQIRQDFVLVLVVGYIGRQSEYRDLVSNMAADRSYVYYYESIEEKILPKYFNAADICIFPSVGYESLPTVIFEAAACEKNIVTQNAWGIPEAIKGHFIQENEIASHSFDYLLNDLIDYPTVAPVKYENFQKFSWGAGKHKLLKIYNEVLNK
ncbi:glycosyltransferase family 4 protein [Neptuniibacter sp. QD48_11]|uniref:glycosyltransferase family 4 protein n=1 Tax=unclassified Neptuniibacter TaxID=2630693 RepID=UPI0039F5BD41